MDALVTAARAGLGVALVPDHLVANDLVTGRLINLLPNYQCDTDGIYIVYSSRRHPPAALRAFLDFYIEHIVISVDGGLLLIPDLYQI